MFNFKNKDSEFFDLFLESAQYFHKCAVMMDEVMQDYSKAEAKMREIIDLEHEADAVNDRIIDKLNQTFITPIDREDIHGHAAACRHVSYRRRSRQRDCSHEAPHRMYGGDDEGVQAFETCEEESE